MDVSVIIVNYNTMDLTKETIDSIIYKTKGIEYEIILVDNASTDGSIEFFTKNYKNRIIFIKNEENLGFGKANNKGIEVAKGKYIFLLNSDTILINNAIKILYDFMEKNLQCGISGGNLFDKNLNPAHSYSLAPPGIISEINYYLNFPLKFFRKLIKKRNDFNYTNSPKEVVYITGADMMIRASVLNLVGKFDEDFFMYCEEAELSHRVVKNGYKIISIPQAHIIHLESKSTKIKKKKIQMMFESKYKCNYKILGYKKCKYIYLIMQFSFIIRSLFKNKKDWLNIYQINKKEYQRFLQKYKS